MLPIHVQYLHGLRFTHLNQHVKYTLLHFSHFPINTQKTSHAPRTKMAKCKLPWHLVGIGFSYLSDVVSSVFRVLK